MFNSLSESRDVNVFNLSSSISSKCVFIFIDLPSKGIPRYICLTIDLFDIIISLKDLYCCRCLVNTMICFLANHAFLSHTNLSDLPISNRKSLNYLVYSLCEYLLTNELFFKFIINISYKYNRKYRLEKRFYQ